MPRPPPKDDCRVFSDCRRCASPAALAQIKYGVVHDTRYPTHAVTCRRTGSRRNLTRHRADHLLWQ
jgi:hypothetical protein